MLDRADDFTVAAERGGEARVDVIARFRWNLDELLARGAEKG